MSLIRLNLQKLVTAGAISPDEALRLRSLAEPDRRGGLAVNLFLIFGAVAVAAGTIALIPNAATGLVLALAALAGGEALRRTQAGAGFGVLAMALSLTGLMGLAGWISLEMYDAQGAQGLIRDGLIAAMLGLGALWYRSGFLAALAVLAIGALIGSGTGYAFASYWLMVREPLITLLLFSAMAGGLYALRARVREAYAPVAHAAARTAFLMANFGFWVGSLWGDRPGEHWQGERYTDSYYSWAETALQIPDWAFSLGWAAALAGVILTARRGGFLSVAAIIFVSIHGYTQFFEYFGARGETLLIAGISLVALAVGLAHFLRGAAGSRDSLRAGPPAG